VRAVAVPVVLGTRHFANKTAAASFVSDKLRTLPFGRIDAAEEDWLRALLATHRDSAEKRALATPGAVAHFVKMAPARGGCCFGVVIAATGATIDFSYNKSTLLAAVPRHPGSVRSQKLAKAMRCEVEPQTELFRAAAFAAPGGILCAVTHQRLRSHECHVDHNSDILGNTFVELIGRYRAHLHARGVDLDALPLSRGEEGRVTFANADDGAAWRAWHAQHAVLRVISSAANLSAQAVGKQRMKAKSAAEDDR
jgi:hypothetical protein